MLRINTKGIVLGGLAAYLIIGKGFNTLNHIVNKVCDTLYGTAIWKSYYKHGKDGNMVPPGYSSHTHQINDKEEMVVEKDEGNEKPNPGQTAGERIGEAVGKAIVSLIDDKLKGSDAAEGASEGETEASEEDKSVPEHSEEIKEPFYVDDLFSGVRVVDPDEDEEQEDHDE